ncbi:MAG: hypothetical protein GXO29_01565 [Thermotogae bacterium]|nr:hypothetical protein [Thermotogota bacterium]
MAILLLLGVSPQDTSYWWELAKRLANRIYKDSHGDYLDVKLYSDSTGKYLLYQRRWYVVLPSGYKVWYRSPVAIKLPDNTPDYFEGMVLKELDSKRGWKDRLGETFAAGLGCGMAAIGALFAIVVSLQR